MADYFDYSVNFGLIANNKIVIGNMDIQIPFHIMVNVDDSVAMVPNRRGQIVPGFRLYSPDMSSIIYEGRILEEEIVAFPGQWIPLSVRLPIKKLDGVRRAILVFDLIKEGNFWFGDRGGPIHSFPLEFTDDVSAQSAPNLAAPPESLTATRPAAAEAREPEPQLTPAPFAADPKEEALETLSPLVKTAKTPAQQQAAAQLAAAEARESEPQLAPAPFAADPKEEAPEALPSLVKTAKKTDQQQPAAQLATAEAREPEPQLASAPFAAGPKEEIPEALPPLVKTAKKTAQQQAAAPAVAIPPPTPRMAAQCQSQVHLAVANVPSHRIAMDAVTRSALTHCFRMKALLIDADPASFRAHCYRTLLRRSPEAEIIAQPIAFEDIKARVTYWKSIVLSNEFNAGEAVPPRNELVLRILESLGWSVANTLLGYALRIESVISGTFPQFIQRIASYLINNSYSTSNLDDLFEIEEPAPEYYVLFERLVDLAVEFSLGIARLDNLMSRFEELERRTTLSAATNDVTAVSSISNAQTAAIEVPFAYGLDLTTPIGESFGKTDAETVRRRKPTRWAPR